jgi:hypothetical protein
MQKINQELLAYSDLIVEIEKLSFQKVTGTVFITTDDDHLMRLVLDEGRISSLLLDNRLSGYDAISFFETIKFGKLHFTKNIFETAQEVPLPNTDELFQMFRNKRRFALSQNQGENSESTSVEITDAIERIKKALAEEIGPFAAIVCDEYVKQINVINTMSDILIMIDAVAVEIDDTKAAQAFKDKLKLEFDKK